MLHLKLMLEPLGFSMKFSDKKQEKGSYSLFLYANSSSYLCKIETMLNQDQFILDFTYKAAFLKHPSYEKTMKLLLTFWEEKATELGQKVVIITGKNKILHFTEKNGYISTEQLLKDYSLMSLFKEKAPVLFRYGNRFENCCVKELEDGLIKKRFSLLRSLFSTMESMKDIDPLFCYRIQFSRLSIEKIEYFAFGDEYTIYLHFTDEYVRTFNLSKESYKNEEEIWKELIDFFPKKLKRERLKELTNPEYYIFQQLLSKVSNFSLTETPFFGEFLEYISKKGTHSYDVEIYSTHLLEQLPPSSERFMRVFSNDIDYYLFNFGEMIAITNTDFQNIELVHVMENSTFDDAKEWLKQKK